MSENNIHNTIIMSKIVIEHVGEDYARVTIAGDSYEVSFGMMRSLVNAGATLGTGINKTEFAKFLKTL